MPVTDGMPGHDANADDDATRTYATTRTVDTGSIAQVAVDDDRIALASVSGGVSVVAADPDGTTQFRVEARPQGLAVGPSVYVAADGCVCGYSVDGSRQWETSVDAVSALCWLPDPSQVVAATDTGEFVILDADTGAERRRIDRAHADVSEDVSLAGRDGEFLAGESWYLTGFDAGGDRRGEAMLDGTITGVGLLDSAAVVSLHGGQLVGVADDGTTAWTRTIDAEWLAPRGGDALYAAADRGVVRIDPDGEVTDAGIGADDTARVVTTTDGSLACRLDGRTAEVLRPQASLSGVDLTVSPASLRVGEEVSVAVESRGAPAVGSVTVDADGGSLAPDSQPVSLDGGDRTTARFTLTDATGALIAVRASFEPSDPDAGRTRASADLRVQRSTPTPAVDAECVAVSEGRAVVDTTVRMPDGAELPGVSISPGDVAVDPDPGQSSVTRTLRLPLETEQVTATTDDGEPADAAVSPPTDPLSAAVRILTEGFVDVELSNDTGVVVEDEIRVSGDLLATPVERSVSLDPDARLTLALPAARSGAGEVRVEGATVSVTADVTPDSAAPGLETGGRGSRRSPPGAVDGSESPDSRTPNVANGGGGTPDAASEPVAEASRAGAEPPTPDASPPGSGPDTAGPRPADPADPRVSDATSSDPAEPASSDPEPSQPTGVDDPVGTPPTDGSAGSASSDPLDLTRSLESDTANEGYAIEETLSVENRSSEPRSVTLESGDDRITVEVQAEATRTASRYHAGWDAESIELPAVTARSDGSEATAPPTSVPIDAAPVVARPLLSVRSGETDVRLDVRNNLETACSVLEIGSRGFDDPVPFEGFDLDPGAEGSREVTARSTPGERPALTFVRIDSRRRPIQTVGAVRESTTLPVAVTVESVDVLGDRDTNVVLGLQNEGDVPLDVTAEATGAAPDEYLYAPDDIDGLPPGETATHRVECTVDDDRIELQVDLTATPSDGDDTHTAAVTVSGDRTAEAGAWRVDTGGADSGSDDTPQTLSTPLTAGSAE